MAYYGSTHVDNFEIDCSSGTPYVLWGEDCGYDPPQSPLLAAENPRISCGSVFGDHGWFSTTTSLTTTLSDPHGLVVSWNGTELWSGLTGGSSNKGWFGYDGNTSTNAGTLFEVDQSTITLNANGGRQYYGKLYKHSGNFVQVGAITSGQGWRHGNYCGSNPNSPNDVYVSCVKRSSYYHGSPTVGGGSPLYGAQIPSAACGAPYGDGWFEVECGSTYTRTIIVVEGVDVYDGPWIARTGNDVEITIGDYRYIRSAEPGSSFAVYSGWETTGCGGLSHPQGCGGNGRGVYRVPID